MCTYIQLMATKTEIIRFFKLRYMEDNPKFKKTNFINGYDNPAFPIYEVDCSILAEYHKWGINNYWFDTMRVPTLYLDIDHFGSEKDFTNYYHEKCLIPATGIYYHAPNGKWFLIKVRGVKIFAMAGFRMMTLNPLQPGYYEKSFCIFTEPMSKTQPRYGKDFHLPVILNRWSEWDDYQVLDRHTDLIFEQVDKPAQNITDVSDFVKMTRRLLSGK